MALGDDGTPVELSLLDRLIDHNPGEQREIRSTAAQSLAQLRAMVRRDLEALLNTRNRCRPWPQQLGEIGQSLVSYGLPDRAISGMSGGDWRNRLRQAIEDAVRIYEPRLTGVSVKIVEDTPGFERAIRFRIEATLRVDAVPETVTFDSQIESATRVVLVSDR